MNEMHVQEVIFQRANLLSLKLLKEAIWSSIITFSFLMYGKVSKNKRLNPFQRLNKK
jgi:hypothetical protein